MPLFPKTFAYLHDIKLRCIVKQLAENLFEAKLIDFPHYTQKAKTEDEAVDLLQHTITKVLTNCLQAPAVQTQTLQQNIMTEKTLSMQEQKILTT